MNDAALKRTVQHLQKDIVRLARKYKYKDFRFWDYLEYHVQEPREGESCASILTCDGGMLGAFDGYYDSDFQSDFDEVTENAGFFYEFQQHGVAYLYSLDDQLDKQYRDLLEWQWIVKLIQPEYSSLYNELFNFFNENPEKFYFLKPRQLEIYVGEVFRNQGYDVEMGPGTNDGGIDLRLFQKQDIDQITTLVQVKRYKNELPIRLDAVAALYGHVEAEKAQEGLFVTTSRYLPGARNFANRVEKKVTLSDSNDLANWSNKVKTIIEKDKSRLISDEYLLQLVYEVNIGKKKGLILVHNVHSGMIYSEYALILKEAKFAALIIMLPKKYLDIFDPPYNTVGNEVPVLDRTILKNKTNEHIIRATVLTGSDGSKAYVGRDMYFTVWNGEPGRFDLND